MALFLDDTDLLCENKSGCLIVGGTVGMLDASANGGDYE